MVGLGNRIEVWNARMYEDYLLKDPSELSALAQKYLNEE
jgi:DNA-binding transcriptional regulator/RsmH inhibitor MraZ